MAEPVAAATPRYLKTPDAAIHLGLSARTLEKHRCFGTGPVFRRLGGRIVYAIDDLDAWAALTSLIHDARFRVRSGHLLRLAVLRGRPASLAFVSPHSD